MYNPIANCLLMLTLGFDAQQVIHLRLNKIMAGGADAQEELVSMVFEKVAAFSQAALAVAGGERPDYAIQGIGDVVSANLKRLREVD